MIVLLRTNPTASVSIVGDCPTMQHYAHEISVVTLSDSDALVWDGSDDRSLDARDRRRRCDGRQGWRNQPLPGDEERMEISHPFAQLHQSEPRQTGRPENSRTASATVRIDLLAARDRL